MKPVPEAAVGAVRDTLRESGEPVSAGGMTFMQARTANEVLKAQERPGDQLTVGSDNFVVQGEPERRDPDRLVWSLDVRPV
jgi:hypothetical protein